MEAQIESIDENYEKKAKDIFNLLNYYRKNPKELAKKLELIKTYLDPNTNILSEPNKTKLLMIEGKTVFEEAINFLKKLSPLEPLQWDDNLCLSAKAHINDIGPKGLLIYQSSDGTKPEDRISKYGTYIESLGENIDFGPNDAIGVIVSLTLDEGEEERPQRNNMFKNDYKKVGIACGPHKTEFQMCVMDFAYDFIPYKLNSELKLNEKKDDLNNQLSEEKKKNENLLELNKTLDEKYKNMLLSIKRKDEEIIELKKQIEKLKKELEHQKSKKKEENAKLNSNKELNINLMENNLKKEIEKLKLKLSRFPFELEEGEKLFCLRFLSMDQKINYYSIICKNTDKFSKLEEKLYEQYPNFANLDNIFTFNGTKVNKHKNLIENKIEDNAIILLITQYN